MLRALVAMASLALCGGASWLVAGYLRRPRAERLLATATAVLLCTSYVALLVCAAALGADLAGHHAEFRWYATPLLAVAVACGWVVVGMAWRDSRRR